MKVIEFVFAVVLFAAAFALFGFSFSFPYPFEIIGFFGGILCISGALALPAHVLGRLD